MKLASSDLENPRFGTKCGTYLLYMPSYSEFCIQKPIFVTTYHGNRGPSETSSNDTIKLADTETPHWYQKLAISPTDSKSSYSQYGG